MKNLIEYVIFCCIVMVMGAMLLTVSMRAKNKSGVFISLISIPSLIVLYNRGRTR